MAKNKKKANRSIFKDLDRIFRGKPLVRRKVRPNDTRIAMPDKNSSGMAFFQKSVAPTYSNITSVAYNISERLVRYQDFQQMEATPELSKALDLYADETVSQDEKGQVLHIHSDDDRIQEELSDLFYGTLNTDYFLRPCARNLVKYGDVFYYIDISPKYGVQNLIPMPVNEVEREENFDPEDPFSVRFRWIAQNREMSNWEVAHFRLIGNDLFLPYGSSILESARRIWRQLILIEDAMLVYRIVRAPERRVFYIDIANIHPNDVEHYVEDARAKLRTAQVIDRDQGRIDLRYNSFPVHKDTPVPLLDGTTLTIENLSKKMDENPNEIIWVYSIQDETQQVVPGKVVWCGKNYTAKKLVKVWLDDESYVTTAPEHPFVMRDGSHKRADELCEGESLMPFYRKLSKVEDGCMIKDYEMTYNPGSQKYEYTHKLVADNWYNSLGGYTVKQRRVIHHVDYNKRNNVPTNLKEMTYSSHRQHHIENCNLTLNTPEMLEARRIRVIKYNKSEEKRNRTSELNKKRNSVAAMAGYNGSDLHKKHNKQRSSAMKNLWNDSKKREVVKKNMRWMIPDQVFEKICEIVKNHPKWGREKVHNALISNESIMTILKKAQTGNRDIKKFSFGAWEGDLIRRGYKKLPGLRESIVGYKNHKISKIEHLDVEGEDVYCMTVVGPNEENDRHNFAVCSILSDGTKLENGVFVVNSVDEDFFIPVRGQESATKIDTLQGGQNAAAVEDVEYIQKKIFAAVGVPRAYLGYEDALSSKSTLAQEDIRFSRTVTSIQKVIVAELNKIAMIHLYVNGFRGNDLVNFKLMLSNPSTIAQQQKLELISAKFDIAANFPEGFVDRKFVQREVLGLTDDEIDEIKKGREEDRLEDAKLEQIGAGAEGAGGGGGGDLFGGGGAGGGGEEFGGEDLGGETGGGDLGDLGGAEGGEGEAAAEEPEEGEIEDLEAGDDHVEDADDEDEDVELLLSVDDANGNPIKPNSRVERDRYNKSRRKKGPKGLNPDTVRNLNRGDMQDDPFDFGWLASKNKFESTTTSLPMIDSYTANMLEKMGKSDKFASEINSSSSILTESVDNEDVFVDDDDD